MADEHPFVLNIEASGEVTPAPTPDTEHGPTDDEAEPTADDEELNTDG